MLRYLAMTAFAVSALYSPGVFADEVQNELHLMRLHMKEMQKRVQYLEQVQRNQEAAISHVELKRSSGLSLGSFVNMAPDHSSMIHDWQNDVVGKPLKTLEARRDGGLRKGNVYWGGLLKGSLMGEATNTKDKFAILSRFPTQHSGSTGSRFVVNNVALSATATMHDWVTATALFDYSETEYASDEAFDMRKAYLTVGNLKESPFYAMVGRNTVDFANSDSFNPFTHTMNNHYFRVESDGPVIALGYAGHGTHVVATLMNGGRHQRVASHPDGNHMKNFAVNATQTIEVGGQSLVKVGAGYLHSSIYDSLTPHHTPAGIVASEERTRNGVWNAYAEAKIDNVALMAEFSQTLDNWFATGHKVRAWTVQGEYFFDNWGRPASLSATYSRGEQGADGVEWEFMEQAVLGYESEVADHFYLGAEYVFNHGFVPLINILNDSDSGVVNHSLVLGGRYVF